MSTNDSPEFSDVPKICEVGDKQPAQPKKRLRGSLRFVTLSDEEPKWGEAQRKAAVVSVICEGDEGEVMRLKASGVGTRSLGCCNSTFCPERPSVGGICS